MGEFARSTKCALAQEDFPSGATHRPQPMVKDFYCQFKRKWPLLGSEAAFANQFRCIRFSCITDPAFLPFSAAAIRPAIASDARRSGSLSRWA